MKKLLYILAILSVCMVTFCNASYAQKPNRYGVTIEQPKKVRKVRNAKCARRRPVIIKVYNYGTHYHYYNRGFGSKMTKWYVK